MNINDHGYTNTDAVVFAVLAPIAIVSNNIKKLKSPSLRTKKIVAAGATAAVVVGSMLKLQDIENGNAKKNRTR